MFQVVAILARGSTVLTLPVPTSMATKPFSSPTHGPMAYRRVPSGDGWELHEPSPSSLRTSLPS
jgi:hypothetical protein